MDPDEPVAQLLMVLPAMDQSSQWVHWSCCMHWTDVVRALIKPGVNPFRSESVGLIDLCRRCRQGCYFISFIT